jgi:hypothetical protein
MEAHLEVESAGFGNLGDVFASSDLVQSVQLFINMSTNGLFSPHIFHSEVRIQAVRASAYLEHVVVGSILQVAGTIVGLFKLGADHDDNFERVILSYERMFGGCLVVELLFYLRWLIHMCQLNSTAQRSRDAMWGTTKPKVSGTNSEFAPEPEPECS